MDADGHRWMQLDCDGRTCTRTCVRQIHMTDTTQTDATERTLAASAGAVAAAAVLAPASDIRSVRCGCGRVSHLQLRCQLVSHERASLPHNSHSSSGRWSLMGTIAAITNYWARIVSAGVRWSSRAPVARAWVRACARGVTSMDVCNGDEHE